MCLDHTGAATTTTQRIHEAIASLRKLKWIRLSKQEKAHIIDSNILPAALYGIELTGGCPSAVKALQAATADVIGSRAAKRSQLGSFEVQKSRKT